MTRIAFGTSTLVGAHDQKQAFDLLDAAWQLGIRRFDTAPTYGAGLSEQIIGKWASANGVVPEVWTKVGLRHPLWSHVPAATVAPLLSTAAKAKRVLGATQARISKSHLSPETVATSASWTPNQQDTSASAPVFDLASVLRSVKRSQRALRGLQISRLALHQVSVNQLNDENTALLNHLKRAGYLKKLTLATSNLETTQVLGRYADVFDGAQVAGGPLSPGPLWFDGTKVDVVHSIFGTKGRGVRALEKFLGAHSLRGVWAGAERSTDVQRLDIYSDLLRLTLRLTSQDAVVIFQSSSAARLRRAVELASHVSQHSNPLTDLELSQLKILSDFVGSFTTGAS